LVVERRLRQPAARLAVDGWLLQRKGIGPLLGKLETARLARTARCCATACHCCPAWASRAMC
ncbi:hypothetical protein N4Q63_26055, partial [Leclercia adecarboxylata]|uniref:hypothetical protein n=1 Tax=Leclercia adecarboxylata TaxID=83655 RepID=UPI00234DFE61|nr:hypothetical protein [Leclercia adecarboxylata]